MLPKKYSRNCDESNFQSLEISNLNDKSVITEVKKEQQDVYALPFARVSRTVRRRSKEEEDAEVRPGNDTFDWDAIGHEEFSSFSDSSSTLENLLGVKSSQRVDRKVASCAKVRYWLDRKDLPHPSKLRSSGRDKKRKRTDDDHVLHHVAQLKRKRTDFDCLKYAGTNGTDVRVRAVRDCDNSMQQVENFQLHTHTAKSIRDTGSFRCPETAPCTPSPTWHMPGYCGTSGIQQVPTMSPADSNFLRYSTDLDSSTVGNPCYDQASYWTESIQVKESQPSYCQQYSSEPSLTSQGQQHVPHSLEPVPRSLAVSSPSSADVEPSTCIINPDPLGILATMRQRGPDVFQKFMNLYTEE